MAVAGPGPGAGLELVAWELGWGRWDRPDCGRSMDVPVPVAAAGCDVVEKVAGVAPVAGSDAGKGVRARARAAAIRDVPSVAARVRGPSSAADARPRFPTSAETREAGVGLGLKVLAAVRVRHACHVAGSTTAIGGLFSCREGEV